MMKAVVLIVGLAAPLMAQRARTATIGDRVRVIAPKSGHGKLVGLVTSTTPDALGLKVDGAIDEVAVQRDQINSIDLSVATRRHPAPGAFIGGVVGLVIANSFGPKTDAVQGIGQEVGTRTTAKNLVTGTLMGASIGAFVGSFVRTDRWVAISPSAR